MKHDNRTAHPPPSDPTNSRQAPGFDFGASAQPIKPSKDANPVTHATWHGSIAGVGRRAFRQFLAYEQGKKCRANR
jgi:hypothetical protein